MYVCIHTYTHQCELMPTRRARVRLCFWPQRRHTDIWRVSLHAWELEATCAYICMFVCRHVRCMCVIWIIPGGHTCMITPMKPWLDAYMHAHTNDYEHTCMHTQLTRCMHACTHKWLHVCIHAHTNDYMYACMHTQMITCMHACTHKWLHVCMHAQTNDYMYAYMANNHLWVSNYLQLTHSSERHPKLRKIVRPRVERTQCSWQYMRVRKWIHSMYALFILIYTQEYIHIYTCSHRHTALVRGNSHLASPLRAHI